MLMHTHGPQSHPPAQTSGHCMLQLPVHPVHATTGPVYDPLCLLQMPVCPLHAPVHPMCLPSVPSAPSACSSAPSVPSQCTQCVLQCTQHVLLCPQDTPPAQCPARPPLACDPRGLHASPAWQTGWGETGATGKSCSGQPMAPRCCGGSEAAHPGRLHCKTTGRSLMLVN